MIRRAFWGEFIGTSMLVFFGCSAVAVSVLFKTNFSLLDVALIWGMGVTLAIYCTRALSCAHLNPAVSIGMVVAKRMSLQQLPIYLLGQCAGATFGALVLYLIFNPIMAQYETLLNISRGTPASIVTAQIFGEFYPNLGTLVTSVSPYSAFAAECVGTFILMFVILSLTENCNVGRPKEHLGPLFIGLSLTILIALFAPFSQAGFNPARDLCPRLVAYVFGWRNAAFPDHHGGALTIYVLAPILGAVSAAFMFSKFILPIMNQKPTSCCSKDISL